MPVPQSLKEADTELTDAIEALDTLEENFQATRAPFLAAKAALTAGIDRVTAADKKAEELHNAYEAPAKPQPE